MNLFAKQRNRRLAQKFQMQKIDGAVLECIMQFAGKVELPVPPSKVQVELIDDTDGKMAGHRKERVPYYLLMFAEDGEWSLLNAGYLLGQISSFLHFQGISSQILDRVPDWVSEKTGEKLHCVAVLAMGRAEEVNGFFRRYQSQAESPCICREHQENWTEEVLELAGKRCLLPSGSVRILPRGDELYFIPKASAGKKAAAYELETGIAIAGIMTAAEELWIDLSLIRSKGKRCFIGVTRSASR